MAAIAPLQKGSPSRLDRFADLIAKFVPDAFTAAVIMMILLAGAALMVGNSVLQILDAYYRGFWMLLPFAMQMTLIVVLSSSLASTPAFRRMVAGLARLPRTASQLMALSILLTAIAGYCYWGLGMTLGPVIAVYFAREAERKGISIDFPFFLAATCTGNAVWQFGFSATAPLMVATPGHFLEGVIGTIPLARTIWSPAAILHVVAFTVALILFSCRLVSTSARPISEYPSAHDVAEPVAQEAWPAGETYSERLERQPYLLWVLCASLAAWLYFHFAVKRLSLDLNSLNTTLLLVTLLLHGNFRSFVKALERAVVAGWPVIVMYHLYSGLAGLIQFTEVGPRMAALASAVSNRYTYTLLTAAVATVFSFFIPSSGGQWAVQGFVTVKSALAVGVTAERGLLAMSVGDHMGNLISPFWYMVISGIVRLNFRVFFGYGLLFAVLWFVIGVLSFTLAPC